MGWRRRAVRRQPSWLCRPLGWGPRVLLPQRPRCAGVIAGASAGPVTRAGLRRPRQPVRGPRTRVSGPRGPGPPAAVDAGPDARSGPGTGTGTRTRVGTASTTGCSQGEPRAGCQCQRGSEPAELHGERDAVSSDVGNLWHGVGDKSPSVSRVEGCLVHSWCYG